MRKDLSFTVKDYDNIDGLDQFLTRQDFEKLTSRKTWMIVMIDFVTVLLISFRDFSLVINYKSNLQTIFVKLCKLKTLVYCKQTLND